MHIRQQHVVDHLQNVHRDALAVLQGGYDAGQVYRRFCIVVVRLPAARVAYNQRVCTAISKAGGLLAALDPRDVETLPKVWEPLNDPQNPKSTIVQRSKF